MKTLKLLLVAATLLQIPNVMAWNPFGSKLQVYECKTRFDTNECSSGCQKVAEATVEFKVNIEKSLVQRINYEGGKQISSSALDNCKVIDVNNWSCSYDKETERFSSHRESTMANGIFYSWTSHTSYPNPRLVEKGWFSEAAYCAK